MRMRIDDTSNPHLYLTANSRQLPPTMSLCSSDQYMYHIQSTLAQQFVSFDLGWLGIYETRDFMIEVAYFLKVSSYSFP
jgi:hypothetical protein